jgi:hypothetical protein
MSVAYAEILAAAKGALATTWGRTTDLELVEVVYDYENAPSTVLRCNLRGTDGATPPTVIVKRANSHQEGLRREAAGLVFVNGLPEAADLLPRYYAHDPEAAVLVMEDLGTESHHLLGNILFEGDREQAEAALLALNQSLGRLHGATIGQQGTYQAICREFRVGPTTRHRVHSLVDHLMALGDLFASMSIPVGPGFDQEIAWAVAELREPGPFLTFTHGDATPANLVYTPAGARLFDLETSEFRHALVDGAFARLRYIHSVWARRIPIALQQRLAVAYREALIPGCPAAAEDTLFHQGLIAGCAAWLAALCSLLPSVRAQDKRWGRATNRQRIVAALEHFVLISREVALMPYLAEAVRLLQAHLRLLWAEGDTDLALYPAFAPEPA